MIIPDIEIGMISERSEKIWVKVETHVDFTDWRIPIEIEEIVRIFDQEIL